MNRLKMQLLNQLSQDIRMSWCEWKQWKVFHTAWWPAWEWKLVVIIARRRCKLSPSSLLYASFLVPQNKNGPLHPCTGCTKEVGTDGDRWSMLFPAAWHYSCFPVMPKSKSTAESSHSLLNLNQLSIIKSCFEPHQVSLQVNIMLLDATLKKIWGDFCSL